LILQRRLLLLLLLMMMMMMMRDICHSVLYTMIHAVAVALAVAFDLWLSLSCFA